MKSQMRYSHQTSRGYDVFGLGLACRSAKPPTCWKRHITSTHAKLSFGATLCFEVESELRLNSYQIVKVVPKLTAGSLNVCVCVGWRWWGGSV